MDVPLTSRKGKRSPVTMAAQCRTATGIRDEGYLSDISPEGCRISIRGMLFVAGARVTIKPKGMEGLSGIVRWIDGHTAGIEFDSPIYGPVVEHLARQFAAGTPVAVSHG